MSRRHSKFSSGNDPFPTARNEHFWDMAVGSCIVEWTVDRSDPMRMLVMSPLRYYHARPEPNEYSSRLLMGVKGTKVGYSSCFVVRPYVVYLP